MASKEPGAVHPLLYGHRPIRAGDLEPAQVEDADFGHDWERADGLAVDVASDMRDPFVSRDRLHIIPAVLGQQRMDRGPADFGVPKPQRRRGVCLVTTRLHMRPVPLGDAIGAYRCRHESPGRRRRHRL